MRDRTVPLQQRTITPAVRRRGGAVLGWALLIAVCQWRAADAGGWIEQFADDPNVTVKSVAPSAQLEDDWTPVSAEALRRYLQQHRLVAEGRAPFAVVESAVYSATFTELGIEAGTCRFQITHRGEGGAFLDWSQCNLALHELTHSGQPAIWGTAADERKLVEVVDSGLWTARWNARRRRRLGRVGVELTLPEALNSRLEIRVPRGYSLSSSAGLVREGVPDPSDGRWNIWSVDLGRRNTVRLSLDDENLHDRPAFSLGRMETLYNARVDGLYLQADATVSQGGGTLPAIVFRVPPAAQILSVSFGGSPIPFERSDANPGEVRVVLAGTAAPRGRIALRLQAFQAVDWDRPRIALPRIDFGNVVEIGRTARLSVESPLVVGDISTSGLLQSGLQQNELGEVWSFLATAQRSRLLVTIQRPDPKVMIRSRIVADLTAAVPVAAAEISLEGQEGSEFELGLDWPPGWDVVALEGMDSASRLSRWDLVEEENARTLRIEFRQPILPGAKRLLRLRARAQTGLPGGDFELPVPLLRESGSCQTACWLVVPPTETAAPVGETRYTSEQVRAPPADVLALLPGGGSVSQASVEQWSWSGNLAVARPRMRLSPAQPPDGTESPEQEGAAGGPPPGRIPSVSGPLTCTVKLTTTLASTDGGRHVHRASYLLSRPAYLQELGLKLHDRATLSQFSADGTPVTVLRPRESLQLPAELAPCRRFEIIYATPSLGRGICRRSRFQLPTVQAKVLHLDWLVELPRGRQLASTNVPAAASDHSSTVSLGTRLFGPLYRGGTDSWFAPWSGAEWRRAVAVPEPNAAVDESYHRVQIVSTTVPGEIVVSTWDREFTQLIAWICLLASLMAVTIARMLDSGPVGRACVVWLMLLCGVSFLVEGPWAVILGGAVSGTLLGLLIPRRLVRQRDLLRAISPRQRLRLSSLRKPAATAGAIVVGLAGSAVVTVPARIVAQAGSGPIEVLIVGEGSDPEGLLVRPNVARAITHLEFSQKSVEPLIRTARYRLSSNDSSVEVQATFEVLVREPSPGALIALPLRNVVFRQDHSCTVDGTEVPIIPGLDGQAILVRLPGDPAGSSAPATPSGSEPERAEETASPGNPWKVHVVAMSFLVRGQSTSADGLQFACRIPGVADAIAETNGPMADLDRYGTRDHTAEGASRFSIGGITHLESISAAMQPASATASVLTHLDVAPLGLTGSMQISLAGGPLAGVPRRDHVVSVQLPSRCLVRNVTGEAVVEWHVRTGQDDRSTLGIVLESPEESLDGPRVTVEFDMPLSLEASGEFPLPLLTVESATITHHDVGISVPPRWTVEPVGELPFSTEDFDAAAWQQFGGQSRSRLAWTGRIVTAPQARWRLSRPLETWTWRIDETVRIAADRVHWRAQLDSGMSPARIFFDSFRLPRHVLLESVSAVQSGRQRPVRWSRRGDELSLFFTDEISGPLTVFMEGSVPLVGEVRTALPDVRPMRDESSSSRLTVLDETGWSVELSGMPGDALQYPGDPDKAGMLRTLNTFSDRDPHPSHIRVVPGPDAAGATLVTSAARVGGRWELTTYMSVSARKGVLRTVIIDLPARQQLVRLLPDRIEKSSVLQEDGTTRLTLRIPPRFAAGFKPVLVARVSEEPGRIRSIAGPTIKSAVEEARWLILPASLSKRISGDAARQASASEVPEFIPASWARQLQNGQANAFSLSAPAVSLAPAARRKSAAAIPLAELALQETAPGHQHGELTWWLVTSDLQRMEFDVPEGAVVSGVFLDGVAAPMEQTRPGRYTLAIDRPDTVVPVTVMWERQEGANAEWPRPVSLDVGSQFVAVAGPRLLQAAQVPPLEDLEAAIIRWERLLDCLKAPGISLSMDTALLAELRRWHDHVTRRVASLPVGERREVRERISRLELRWKALQKEIVVTAGMVGAGQIEFPGDLFRRCLELADSEPAAGVYLVPGGTARLGLVESSSWNGAILRILAAGAAVVVALLVNFVLQRWPVREWFDRHAGLSLAVLGMLWWLWLVPSLIGFVITAAGLAAEAVTLVRRLRSTSQGPQPAGEQAT